MDQLDAIRIGDREEARLGQKFVGIMTASLEQTQQACQLGQFGKERVMVGLQPAIKGTILPTTQRKQQANGDDFTIVQVGIRALFDVTNPIVYHAKQAEDDLVHRHVAAPWLCCWFGHRTSYQEQRHVFVASNQAELHSRTTSNNG